MNKSPKNRGAAKVKKSAPQEIHAVKSKRSLLHFSPRLSRILTYGLGFAALFVFLTWGYGDVLSRAEQDSYVSNSPDTMYYLTSQPMGQIYLYTRWMLLIFKWTAVGGAALALVYTLTARLTDYALRIPRQWEGVGFIVALGQIGWMLSRGTNLYYKNEPSLFIFIALCALAVSAIAALLVWFVCHRKKANLPESVRPYGLLTALVLIGGTSWSATHFNENEILTARLQKLTWEQKWDEMIEVARSARQPSRAVAAYHAIALVQTNQLLEGMFEIPYEYPKLEFDKRGGSEEYGIFLADCSYFSGLLNVGYRCSMDQVVMNGVRLSNLKRMTACALLNGEKALCKKYLKLIAQNPLEEEFVKKYTDYLEHPELVKAEPEFQNVLAHYPEEDYYEQNYMPPAFLGFNMGLSRGTDATLITSAAACLYSKDLKKFLPRAQVMAQKGMNFPRCMQEAIAILALKQPALLNQFPQVGQFVPNEITSFLLDAKPYMDDRLEVRHKLRDRWLGSYVYYYYTENNDPDQVAKSTDSEDKAGVN